MFTRNAALFLALLASGASAFVAPSQSRMSTRLAESEVETKSESALVSEIKVAVCPFVACSDRLLD